ncbi:MAG: hypothetical protein H6Q89_5125, partial [Myxococcaceae bacterium]|nr:hypothetical protein [Myxococcaceae bacterium]
GSLAVSRDDALLYVADADHDRLTLIDSKTGFVVRHVPVGRHPERVAVGPDGTVFVTNRGSRTVTQLTRDGMVQATVEVGAAPIGLSVSRDGKRLFVANSTSGTVSELDTQPLAVRRTIEVGGTPWALAVHPDGQQLFVSDFLEGQLKIVPLTGGRIEAARLEQPAGAWCQGSRSPARQPAQAADVILSPEGDRVFVAHVQSRTTNTGSLAFAVAPALSTVDSRSRQALLEQPTGGLDAPEPDFPATLLATQLDEQCAPRGGGLDAPSSLVIDGLGEWIFVADHNSNAVAVVSATRRVDERFASPERGIYGVVRVGARPTGIAVAGDVKSAWVHNSLDYTVSKIELREGRLLETQVYAFGQSELAPDVERGRRLFYSAVDPRLSQPQLGGLSCSSCHPEGGTDGLSWSLPNAISRERNTPALWQLQDTAPYAWDGTRADLPTFNAHMVNQMGGDGLSRVELLDVSAFLGTLQAPDNPNVATLRGALVFEQSCGSCHAGEALTDRKSHSIGGTRLDTPSLRAVFATGPWLHDGSAGSLREALWHPGGAPSTLTSSDAEDLEQFLRSR